VALFARYAPIVGLPPLAAELAARLRDPRAFEIAEIAATRGRFGDHVRGMASAGILSDDDAIFPDLFPPAGSPGLVRAFARCRHVCVV
jgi:hypothetical protein